MLVEGAKGILILEFINAEQFPGQIRDSVPFLKGYANLLGTPCRWVRFGLASAHFFHHGKDAVSLDSDELRRVDEAIESMQPCVPDLVLTTHAMGPELSHLLVLRLAQAKLVRWDEMEWTRQWPKGPLPLEMGRHGFRPDYRWEAGNSLALRHDSNNIYVLGSVGCGYYKPVEYNPHFSDLNLPKDLMGGCSFCGARIVPAQMLEAFSERGEDCSSEIKAWRALVAGTLRIPLEFVRLQIETIAENMAPARLPNALLFKDIERPEVLVTAMEAMRALDVMKSVKLLAGLRVDRLLQLESWLRESFVSKRVEDSASRLPPLQIFSCGLENFVQEELDRFNKGTTTLMNLRAVNLLKELERESEGRFYYSGYMGLSVLLFTPWTTLADLHLNARLLLHLELENEVGNLFMSRLRLHQDLAITMLARHDGALTANEDDPALVLNRRKLFEEELAWQHKDVRMRAVASVAVRLEPNECLLGDPLYELVHTLLLSPELMAEVFRSRANRRRILVEALVAVVETAAEAEAVLDEPAIVRGAAVRLAASMKKKREAVSHSNLMHTGVERWSLLSQLLECQPVDAAESETSQRREGWEKAIELARAPDEATLFSLNDCVAEAVAIRVLGSDEHGLDYDQKSVRVVWEEHLSPVLAEHTLEEALRRGDRLLLRPGQIQVQRQGKSVALWTASVGIWYPQRVWHAAEWRELARAALRNADPEAQAAATRVNRKAKTWIADSVILGGGENA